MFSVRPSKIHGRGCFANQYLRPGMTFRVPCYQVSEETDHTVYCPDDDTIWELYSPFKFLNHSDDPNSWLGYENDSLVLFTLCDIESDEEITIEY